MARRPRKMEVLSEQVEDWYKRARHDLDKAKDVWSGVGIPIHVFTPNKHARRSLRLISAQREL